MSSVVSKVKKGDVQINVIREKCIGAATCVVYAPSTFDLDEEWSMELLEGSSNNVHFQIPFSQVSKIAPLDENESRIVLKNDKILNLGNHNDVTDRNWGLIVWLVNSKYQYIPWNKVNEISFR